MGWKGEQSISESRERITKLDRERRTIDRKQGRVIPNLQSLKLGEAREFRLAVLHIDMVDFKKLTQGLTMLKIMRLVSIFLTELTYVAKEFDGEIEKYVGDRVTALFGVGYDDERATQRSVDCALTMHTIIKYSMNPYLREIGLPKITCSAGIDLGDVWIERVGIKGENQFTLVGHTVSIASQLEEMASSNEILIGHYVYNNLPENEKKRCIARDPPESWTWVYGGPKKKYPFYKYTGHWTDYPLK